MGLSISPAGAAGLELPLADWDGLRAGHGPEKGETNRGERGGRIPSIVSCHKLRAVYRDLWGRIWRLSARHRG